MSLNSGHYTVVIKRQKVLYIIICSFSTIFIYMLALVHDFVRTRSKFNRNARKLLGSAAMSSRCGGMCNDRFVANLVLSLAVKGF